jgi:hypothetical protein
MPQIPQIVSAIQSMAWEPTRVTRLDLLVLAPCHSQFQAILVPSQNAVYSGLTSMDFKYKKNKT